jgi:hypothetical protein
MTMIFGFSSSAPESSVANLQRDSGPSVEHLWAIRLHSSMSPISFRMYLISPMNTGAMHRAQMNSFITGISPEKASAYGGFSNNVSLRYSQ